jgi:tetratricopeptide (TPR) repeat protein
MKQKPAVSAEAEKYEGRAEYAIKNAKNEADFLDAAKEYDKALLLAPWVSSYYFNQAIAYEKAGKPKEAKRSFEFYLLATPNAQDARDVRKRIAGLEYAAEKATSIQANAARDQNKFEDLLRKIDGRRYTYAVPGTQLVITMEVQDKVILFGIIKDGIYTEYTENLSPHVVIRGRETTVSMLQFRKPFMEVWAVEATYIISEDGDRITQRIRSSNGDVRDLIHHWQR